MATVAGTPSEADAVPAAKEEASPAAVPAAESSGLGFAAVLTGITAIIAPVTLITSIAFYFGWVHTDAWARYFGLDPSVLGLTTRDYVLASLRPLFLPVVTVLVILIGVALVHAFVDRTVETDLAKHYAVLWKTSVIVGAALLVSGAIAVFGTVTTHYLFGTLAPAAGVVLITYGIALRRRLHGQPRLPASTHVLVALLAVLSFFWAAGIYAGKVGRATAADLGKHLKELPGAVIYSEKDLDIQRGYGVRVFQLPPTSEFQFAYTGFRLLKRSDGKYFLLPRWWTPRSGAMAVVLRESDTWRIALVPGVHVKSTLSAAEGGGLISAALPTVTVAPALQVPFGPLNVQLDSAPHRPAHVVVDPKSGRTAGRVTISGALNGSAQPLVSGANATCTLTGRSFTCITVPLGRRRQATVTIREANGRSASGRLSVSVGGKTKRLKLFLEG
jgi:hypothetical protein